MNHACSGGDVSVAHCSHGDDHPVDPRGDWGKARLRPDLNEVGEGGEDKAADGYEEDKEPEFLHAVLQSVGDGLESRRVTGQLQYSS